MKIEKKMLMIWMILFVVWIQGLEGIQQKQYYQERVEYKQELSSCDKSSQCCRVEPYYKEPLALIGCGDSQVIVPTCRLQNYTKQVQIYRYQTLVIDDCNTNEPSVITAFTASGELGCELSQVTGCKLQNGKIVCNGPSTIKCTFEYTCAKDCGTGGKCGCETRSLNSSCAEIICGNDRSVICAPSNNGTNGTGCTQSAINASCTLITCSNGSVTICAPSCNPVIESLGFTNSISYATLNFPVQQVACANPEFPLTGFSLVNYTCPVSDPFCNVTCSVPPGFPNSILCVPSVVPGITNVELEAICGQSCDLITWCDGQQELICNGTSGSIGLPGSTGLPGPSCPPVITDLGYIDEIFINTLNLQLVVPTTCNADFPITDVNVIDFDCVNPSDCTVECEAFSDIQIICTPQLSAANVQVDVTCGRDCELLTFCDGNVSIICNGTDGEIGPPGSSCSQIAINSSCTEITCGEDVTIICGPIGPEGPPGINGTSCFQSALNSSCTEIFCEGDDGVIICGEQGDPCPPVIEALGYTDDIIIPTLTIISIEETACTVEFPVTSVIITDYTCTSESCSVVCEASSPTEITCTPVGTLSDVVVNVVCGEDCDELTFCDGSVSTICDGLPGAIGSQGPQGPPGINAGGALIPYGSGLVPIELTTLMGGLPDTVGLVGFGSSGPLLGPLGGSIDLSLGPNMAFSMSRDGIITSISAYFSITVGIPGLGGEVRINAQLYESTTPDNTFVPIPSAIVLLTPPLSIPIIAGEIVNGITEGLAIPVTSQTRLLMVYSITSTGLTTPAVISGHASGSINIL